MATSLLTAQPVRSDFRSAAFSTRRDISCLSGAYRCDDPSSAAPLHSTMTSRAHSIFPKRPPKSGRLPKSILLTATTPAVPFPSRVTFHVQPTHTTKRSIATCQIPSKPRIPRRQISPYHDAPKRQVKPKPSASPRLFVSRQNDSSRGDCTDQLFSRRLSCPRLIYPLPKRHAEPLLFKATGPSLSTQATSPTSRRRRGVIIVLKKD